jgi:nucleotide-binding universal stress UspA family protein
MYRKILVPLDGSDFAECVLPHVEEVVRGSKIEEIIFLRVVEPLLIGTKGFFLNGDQEKDLLETHEKQARIYLDQLIQKLDFREVSLTPEVVIGSAAETIVDYSTHHQLDLIVMATHGRSGISRWLMGSVAERALQWSCIPILMVRPPECVPKL